MKRLLRPLLWVIAVAIFSISATATVVGQTKQEVQNELKPRYTRIDVAYTSGTFDQVRELTIGGGTSKLKEFFDSRTSGDRLLTTIKVRGVDRKDALDKADTYPVTEVEVSAKIKRGSKSISTLRLIDFWMQDPHDSFKWKLHWRQRR